MMRRAIPLVASALLFAAACGSGATSESSAPERAEKARAELPTTTTVHLPKSYKFAPDSIDVAEGAVVTWVNEDDFPHTVRLLDGSGVDKQLGVGDSISITFAKAGVYRYDCSLHPTQMKGSVTVRDTST